MKIEGNKIFFKSSPENYFKEFMGFKSNTVRRMADTEEAKQFLEFACRLNPEYKVHIELTIDPKSYFERTITDITRFEDLFIISWYP